MDELQLYRPLISDAVGKFRFSTAAFLLRHLSACNSTSPSFSRQFVAYLADIYDNFHIIMANAESKMSDLGRLSIPILPNSLHISEIESAYFNSERNRIMDFIVQTEQNNHFESAAMLLKSYYCLCNGFNLGAMVLFSKSLSIIASIDNGFEGTNGILHGLNSYISSIAKPDAARTQVDFSFYVEYDRARVWIRDEYGIDVYEVQKRITPNFRFGG